MATNETSLLHKPTSKIEEQEVGASPAKSFFVNMLTRDISLGDAILDLLDNCVDGILRSRSSKDGNQPYKGFSADIHFNKSSFSIKDNCGGIPYALRDYAFRMGRPADRAFDRKIGSVGVYGIGMKRAIFKIGRHCTIATQNKGASYIVEFTREWMDNENQWNIPLRPSGKRFVQDGTEITITSLNTGVSALLGEDQDAFLNDFRTLVAKHYSFIIQKGFEVRVNGKAIKPAPLSFIFQEGKKNSIRPFIYKTDYDGVRVFLAVGFIRPIPLQSELLDEENEGKYSSIDAGWSVVCNDRAVLYNDKTPLTGWGVSGVPQYHTQFIAIAGIVEFQSDDPAKLPTTTTKRGIEASSELFILVRDKMIEGMKLFTRFTNKWKGEEKEARKIMSGGSSKSFQDIKKSHSASMFQTVKTKAKGSQFKPVLPEPEEQEPSEYQIKFTQDAGDVRTVSRFLFDRDDVQPSRVGKRCFEEILYEASK